MALGVVMVTSLWGPIGPSLAASPNENDAATGETAQASIAVPGRSDPPWHAWRTQTLDEDSGIDTETAVGPNGTTWIAHQGKTADVLGLEHRDASGWTSEEIPSSEFAPDSIVVDDQARPWIAWSEAPTAQIATRNASDDWWIHTLPEGQTDPHIDIGPNGTVHAVLYTVHNDQPNPVYHATFDPDQPEQGWTSTQIADGLNHHPDMAVGPDGRAHAVWDLDPVYHEEQPDGSWATKTLGKCNWGENAIEVDDAGRVHIACQSGNHGLVYYQRSPEGVWSHEVANDGSQHVPARGPSEVGYENDIAVDEKGRPHIVYITGFNPWFPDDPFNPAHPVYTVKLDDGWHVKAVDREGNNAGDHISLALDEAGRPQVGYIYATRVSALSCSDVVNPCFDLRFAEPWSATVAWVEDSLRHRLGVGS